ncbi:hypothetical protein Pelo_664 [Pelomyxa schiedti]|nr:hypothetical protein Pelo_664 [Pelomyxa schiedti]
MSRIVWESVLPWLVPRRLIDGVPAQSALVAEKPKHSVTMCCVGEGMFPLVGRVCRSLLSHHEKYYTVMEAAAEAGATSCVDWLLRDRKRNATPQRPVADTMASSSAAGGCDDDDWDEERCVRRGNKEFIHVLGGLCCGGHLGMAMRLVDGRWPGITWQTDRSGGDSIAARAGLAHHGQLEVAKWMVEKFNIREPWEFAGPLVGAVSNGHLPVAQWIVSVSNGVYANYDQWLDIHASACKSENLAVVKWCFDTFPVTTNNNRGTLLAACTSTKTSSGVAVCKYVIECLGVSKSPTSWNFCRLDVMKYATTAIPFIIPNNNDLARYCKGSFELVKHTVEEYSLIPTVKEFHAACKNKKDDVEVVKWLSTKVTLSPEDLCGSLVVALAKSNTLIASWLDESFSILKQLTSWNLAPGEFFLRVCKGIHPQKGRCAGVEWLLSHAEMRDVGEEFVVKAVDHLLLSKGSLPTVPLLLIERFSVTEPRRMELLDRLLKASIQMGSLSLVKKVVSMGVFTKESVSPLLVKPVCILSSKAVKWLITQFQIEHDNITLDNSTPMLLKLLCFGKENCAEWLITRFHITLNEVLGIPFYPISHKEFDLFAWKMICTKFPDFTSTMTRRECLFFAVQSPVIANFTMSIFPDLSMHDIVIFCSEHQPCRFSLATRCWLRSLLSHHEKYYTVMEAAAEAGATSCVDWLIGDRKRNATQGNRVTDTMASSSAAGGGGDDDWDEERCVRRGNKEFIHVLGGLCCGGHLGMAMRLVDGRWPGITWQADLSGGALIAFYAELSNHVSESAILQRVCENGHLDVAKWMVGKFDIREPWEFAGPLVGAVLNGHLPVAQWIVSTFNVVPYKYNEWLDIHASACKSENLAVVKWCFDTFPVTPNINGRSILAACASAKTSSGVAVCKYVLERPGVSSYVCVASNFRRVDVLKKVTTASRFIIPENSLCNYCKGKGGLELVKHAVEEYSLIPTVKEFHAACKNKKDDVEVVKWLSTKVTLSPEDLCGSLVVALAKSNTLIASWLDESFSILKQLTSWNLAPGEFFLRVCKGIHPQKGRCAGVEWLLSHAEMRDVGEEFVVKAVDHLLLAGGSLPTVPLFLIEKFSVTEPRRTELLDRLLKASIQMGSLSLVKKVVSMGVFTKESVAKFLANALCILSSKAVKWLITHFEIENENNTLYKNMINLLSVGKENCAEWLITRFHITLDEMLGIWFHPMHDKFDLFAWKMICTKFPDLTSTMSKNQQLFFAVQSPVIANFTMSIFPDLSMHDIVIFCSEQQASKFSLATRCWLRYNSPRIWEKRLETVDFFF